MIKARDAAAEDVAAALEQVALAEQAEQVALDAKAAADAALAQARADESVAEDARDDARTAQQNAEAERDRARMAEQAALAAQMTAETRQQEAEDARDNALAAQKTAEDARDDALDAKRQAELELQQVRQQLAAAQAAEQAAREAAEDARERADAAEQRQSQSAEERQFAGFGTSAGTLSVTPRYDAPDIIRTPSIGVGTAGTDVGSWAVTTGSSSDGTYMDSVTVYSDVGMPEMVPFEDSDYNAGRRVVNAQSVIIGRYSISGARTDVTNVGGGTSFPATSAPAQTFPLMDRGYDNAAQLAAATARCDADPACTDPMPNNVRDTNTYRLRYSAEVADAALGGATGRFLCESSSPSTVCTVQRRGTDQLFFQGPWGFIPTTATTPVTVADKYFMWFGVWAREHLASREWSYDVGHGPTGSRVSSVSAVSGTATYAGSAIGRYAIDRELGTDEAGAFTATATLNADFDSNTLSGELTAFAGGAPADAASGGASEWTVNLRTGSISGGNASGTSAWTIGTDADEGGDWTASFYSHLPANQRTGVVPYGVAGTFTAEHSGIAKMIGAFGAHN